MPDPGTYTYAAVSPDTKEWGNDFGKFTDFKVKLEGQGDTIFIRTVKGQGVDIKKPPAQGEQVTVKEFKQNGTFPAKIIPEQSQGGYKGGNNKTGDFRSVDQLIRGHCLHDACLLYAGGVDTYSEDAVLTCAKKFYAWAKGDA